MATEACKYRIKFSNKKVNELAFHDRLTGFGLSADFNVWALLQDKSPEILPESFLVRLVSIVLYK